MHFAARKKWAIFVAIAFAGLALDLLTKHLAVAYLNFASPVSLLGEYVQLFLIYNRGAIFGIDPRSLVPNFPVNVFYYAFTPIAVIALVIYYNSLKNCTWMMYLGIALIMPGALGNFFDRVIHPAKGVVDFIKLGLSPTLYWPIFNLADAYITIGVILVLLELIREEIARKSANAQSAVP